MTLATVWTDTDIARLFKAITGQLTGCMGALSTDLIYVGSADQRSLDLFYGNVY
jgi:hypothetical protein